MKKIKNDENQENYEGKIENQNKSRGINILSDDANKIINSRYWKYTAFMRNAANLIKKATGKKKEHWPKNFNLESYVDLSKEVLIEFQKPTRATLIRPTQSPPHLTCIYSIYDSPPQHFDTLYQLVSLFDRVYILNFGARDLWLEIAPHFNDKCTLFEVSAFQGNESDCLSHFAQHAINEQKSEWLYFFKADDILPFKSRHDFEQSLVQSAGVDVCHHHKYNIWVSGDTSKPQLKKRAEICENASNNTIVSLNIPRLTNKKIKIDKSNSTVYINEQQEPHASTRSFGIYQSPHYTLTQIPKELHEFLQNQEDAQVENRDATQRILREFTLRHGEANDTIINDIMGESYTTTTREISLDFAVAPNLSTQKKDTKAALGFSLDTSNIENTLRNLSTPENTGYSFATQDSQQRIFLTLSANKLNEPLDQSNTAERVQNAIMAAATEIEVVSTNTAWSDHKAILFTLMEATKPRRFVELGTHTGASFYAACQHLKMNDWYGEAIAIDLWEGDHQAGFYENEIFQHFREKLERNFPQNCSYIRKYFHEAVAQFQDKSIDFLHIDGLHTYDAVREDYETWRPKLTDNGVIIFHDTSEYQTDFGVWQLFEEVQQEATASFRFRYCHGLGILAFGERAFNPAIELLEHMNKTPQEFERFYATLGAALYDQALWKEV